MKRHVSRDKQGNSGVMNTVDINCVEGGVSMKTLKKLGNGSVKNYVVLQSRCSCGSCGCGSCSCAGNAPEAGSSGSGSGSQAGSYNVNYSANT